MSVRRLLPQLSIQIGPLGGEHRTRSIEPHQDQLQASVAMRVAEDLECFSLERMTPAGDGHLRREVLDVGSVS